MNKVKLKEELFKNNIKSNLYELEGKVIPDRIILEKQAENKWHVFYFDERGQRDGEQVFDTEEKACLHLYEILVNHKEF